MDEHPSKALASAPRQGHPRSLRLRLMLWYGALLAVALGGFATLVLLIATGAIYQSVDEAVRAEARITTLAVQHKLAATAPYWPSHLLLPTIDTYRDPGAAVEILDAQGRVHYYSASGAATTIPASAATTRAVLGGRPPAWYTTTIGREHVRVEALPIRAPQVDATGHPVSPKVNADGTLATGAPIIGVLLVAKSLSDVDRTLFLLRALLLLGGLATLAGTLAVSWVLATRVLHPLSGIVATARAIVASTARGTRLGSLSQRVPQHAGRDELAQVVDTLNEMLASLESATRAQRRFVADASHELRAPLTTIQGNLAFVQRHLDDLPPGERRTMMADAHEETLRLAQLVEELLLLARSDANVDAPAAGEQRQGGAPGATRQAPAIELDHTLLHLVRQLRGRLSAEGSQVQLGLGHIEPVRVPGEEACLRRVALILLDNALKYTPGSSEAGAGRVSVSLERLGGQAVLRVRDTGIGIAPDDLPHIFERFYRADRARSSPGTGLGLAIAQAEVERLGGRITAESRPGQGSTFSVWLPLA
jgi:two-component system, OmpR family, sensor kinase